MADSRSLLSPVWTHLTEIQPERAEGIYLYDAQGVSYMDFTSGIGVTNTGHCHPKVVSAIQEQARKILFGQMNIVITPQALQLAEALNGITPASLDSFFFSNSGAEAVEASVKLARHATGRRNIIVFQGSFHGRTAQTMAMTTSKTTYSYNYQPLPSGVYVTPFPYSHFYEWDEETTIDFCLKQLRLVLKSQSPPDQTAAIIIEPVLGEGGYVPAPAGFLQAVREICDEYEILLIVDEIQTGFGRTGRMFCFEYSGIVPDILVMAKGLGSGLPISAIAANHEIMSRWKPGTHGGTYGGGSAISLAAAVATIKVIQEEDLVGNAARMGDHLQNRLRDIQKRYGFIQDVRGHGLMIGTEFEDSTQAKAVQKACLNERLLLLTCGTYENVVRWIPPLVINEEQINTAAGIFEKAVASL